jgi:glycine cleavage system H protein
VINSDPYGSGWLVKVRMDDPKELDDLMNEEEYVELTSEV